MAAEPPPIVKWLGDLVSEKEFEEQMTASAPQPDLKPVEEVAEETACKFCHHTGRKLWKGVCDWCCP